MPDRSHPGTLYDQAFSVAEDTFDTDTSGRNADKVCTVALNITSDEAVALFSGKPGFDKLVERVGGNVKDAQRTITARLTEFLKSEAGGGFTAGQITHAGFDPHGRGAMNCAEPKVYYYLRYVKQVDLGTWVMIPFNKTPAGLVYNPPCKNCRRWVYRHFHALSQTIAHGRAGVAAFEP